MSRNTKILTAIIAVSAVLFVFVADFWVNRGVDWTQSHLPQSVAKLIPHAPVVPFRLGLDLLGGAHLLYQADFSKLGDIDKTSAMEGVRDVVERRVNYFGVAEPVVQISGTDRLIVEIAGITDVNQAIKLIGETPFLEFKEQSAGATPTPKAVPIGKDGKVNLGAVADPWAGWKSTGLSGKDVSHASLVFDSTTRRPQVSLELTDAGAKLFAEITKRNLQKPVAIFLDGEPISIPTVQAEITDGHAIISGNFTAAEAKQLVSRLNSGALPVPIKLISQQTIGATLGQKSLNDSLRAGIWGLALVALFMILFYRLPGFTAVAALFVYVLIVLAIYKLLPVTLTLAGIAGFVLSLGIAVDANILIFARMREELVAGRQLSAAVHEGFRRAWFSIRDSHVTALISSFILYAFTTSIVKGFALTLGVGVLASLLTATVVTRTFLNLFVGPFGQKRLWLFK